jgi:hypothetical protein
VIVAVVVVAGGTAAYMMLGRTPAPPKVEVAAIDRATEERIRKETEDRIRSEFAEKAAGEKAASDKAALAKVALDRVSAEKAATEKPVSDKAAAAKLAADKLAADKAVAEKVAAEMAALAKAASDKTAAEKAAAEKMAAEKAAADLAVAQKEAAAKAAAEKLAADKAVAEKAAAEKAALAKGAIAATGPTMQKAGTQSWRYIKYNLGAQGGWVEPREIIGYIVLEDKGGKAVLRTVLATRDACYTGDLEATVMRMESTTTITAKSNLRGCEEMRFVIRTDGTGGQQQTKNASGWVADGLDHDLTPRK